QLERRPPTGIWGGLWSLPEFTDLQEFEAWRVRRDYRLGAIQTLPCQRHTFSHYHLDYTPLLASLENPINNVMEAGRTVWYKARDIDTLGLPTPIKRLLQQHYTEVHNDKNG
ncbi:MAG: NUDIX domain-containing protein, partial [Methylococcaceae bacterium]|nr:NUDIX domain-containing protein [Methylococcaceae bacterium]